MNSQRCTALMRQQPDVECSYGRARDLLRDTASGERGGGMRAIGRRGSTGGICVSIRAGRHVPVLPLSGRSLNLAQPLERRRHLPGRAFEEHTSRGTRIHAAK